MPKTDLYTVLLDRYAREVRDLAGTRVDYAGLRHSPDWQTLLEELEGFDPERLQTREQRLLEHCGLQATSDQSVGSESRPPVAVGGSVVFLRSET